MMFLNAKKERKKRDILRIWLLPLRYHSGRIYKILNVFQMRRKKERKGVYWGYGSFLSFTPILFSWSIYTHTQFANEKNVSKETIYMPGVCAHV